MTLVSEAAEALARAGVCAKATRVEETPECILVYCRGSGAGDLLVAIAAHGDWLYAKAVPESLVKPYMWHCSDIFYNPYGLYSFERTADALAEKLRGKLPRLRAQERLAHHRLAGLAEAP